MKVGITGAGGFGDRTQPLCPGRPQEQNHHQGTREAAADQALGTGDGLTRGAATSGPQRGARGEHPSHPVGDPG